MSRYCTKCGNYLEDTERFCPNCGQPVNTPAPPPCQGQYSSVNPYMKQEEEMSLGKWVGLILLTSMLGIVSIVLLFIWAFGDGPKARQMYCKAALIVQAISVGICIVAMLLFSGLIFGFASRFSSYADDYNRGSYSYYDDNYSDESVQEHNSEAIERAYPFSGDGDLV